jgi:hypothetical protein
MPHYPAPVNLKVHHHSLHLVISLITAGFWVPIWALITWDINRQNRRELDRYSVAGPLMFRLVPNTAVEKGPNFRTLPIPLRLRVSSAMARPATSPGVTRVTVTGPATVQVSSSHKVGLMLLITFPFGAAAGSRATGVVLGIPAAAPVRVVTGISVRAIMKTPLIN